MSKSSLPKELANQIANARAAWKAVPAAREQLAAAQTELQKLKEERENLVGDVTIPASTVARRVPELDILIERAAAAIKPNAPDDFRGRADVVTRAAAPAMADAIQNLYHHRHWNHIETLVSNFRTWARKGELPARLIWQYAAFCAECVEINELPQFNANMDFTNGEENFNAVAAYLEKHADEVEPANARMAAKNILIHEIHNKGRMSPAQDWQWMEFQPQPTS